MYYFHKKEQVVGALGLYLLRIGPKYYLLHLLYKLENT